MKKKTLVWMMALCLIASALGGCGSKEEGTAVERKVLRVGMECAYAPFNWTQTGKEVANGDQAEPIYGTNEYAYGYDIMVAQMLAEEMGFTLEIHKVDWSSIILAMNAGDYDCIIAGMADSEERQQQVDFTSTYYIRNNVLVVRKDSPYASATSLADFTGASATTQIGTIWEEYVPQIPDVEQLTYFETTSEIMMAVAMNAADCGIVDEPTAISAAIANPDLTYVVLPEGAGFEIPEGQTNNVCIAVREGDSELLGLLNDALASCEWTPDKMEASMSEAVKYQPLNN
ncbi:MAG: transporter substrate-binding domain-containing protein [Clostridium sp.]|jgi:putative lysine transport system substrate-binding protein|nr:transporter substrate-binding domain-containing protein [Clostridium sp.]